MAGCNIMTAGGACGEDKLNRSRSKCENVPERDMEGSCERLVREAYSKMIDAGIQGRLKWGEELPGKNIRSVVRS